MKKNFTLLLATLGLVSALSAALTIAHAQTAAPNPPAGSEGAHHRERHPAIHRAIVALQEARHDLERADHDFGGHRKEALEECDKAIAQLKLALQYDKK